MYVSNNPLKYVDPSGHEATKSIRDKVNAPYIEMSETAEKLYDPAVEQAKKDNWNRFVNGAQEVTKGVLYTATGVIVIHFMPAATPLWLKGAVATFGVASIGMGFSDVTEGTGDIYYSATGDSESVAINPAKEIFFEGDDESYEQAESIVFLTTVLGGISSVVLAEVLGISYSNISNYANILNQGKDFHETLGETVEDSRYPLGRSEVSILLDGMPELTGTNREKLLKIIQDPQLASIVNELYRPGATIGDGGTADILINEFYEGSATHLQKAIERLHNLKDLANSGNLGFNDLDILEALMKDLERAISLFK